MRLLIAITICVCGLATSRADELPKPTGASIVDPNAKWELLFTRTADVQGGLTEGPAVAPDGSIYFTDIPLAPDHGMIMRFDPKTKETTVFTAKSGKANGLIFDAEGYLLACEGSDDGGLRVSRWDVKTGKVRNDRRPFHGQTVQCAQRPLRRCPRPHLFHRSEVFGNRTAGN